jgi:hypothetical protein
MKCIIVLLLTIGVFIQSYAQSNYVRDPKLDTTIAANRAIVVKAAGSQYAASGWKQFWWGKHYRREWATPVALPVLDISVMEGGLTPLKLGGGHESKSLRLLSADGREYVLRTTNRTHDAIVPDELKGTVLNDIANDQVSTAHPYGAIAISRMAEAISILHTSPTVYYVADDSRLGEFRDIFANNLALLEERTSGKGWKHNSVFGDADEIMNSKEMLEQVFASSINIVDQEMFLRVRLFDMIINDWDRHEDQWVWAEKNVGKERLYTPIGRDRDQAFSRTDGAAMYLASLPWAFRPLKNFTPDIKDLRGQNFSARNLDRKFLNAIHKDDWQQVITYIQTNLTDAAIENAVNTMPAEVNHISAGYVIKRLKERRDNLSNFGMRYYSILSKRVSITGTSENEKFVVDLNKKNRVSVTGLRSDLDTFFHRVFERAETREINVYALGGDDEYVLRGKNKNNFKIRLIGGEGNNSYSAEQNRVNGRKVRIYDSLNITGKSYKELNVNRRWDSSYRYNFSSLNYNWYIPIIAPGYNQDDGVTIAFGFLYKKRQWGKSPFGWQQQFTVDYATGTSAVGFGYKGIFNIPGKWDFDLNSFYKGPRFTFNYYGLGNETELNGHERSYFRVKANNFYVSPGMSRAWKSNSLRFGLQYETVKILTSPDKFFITAEAKLDSSVFTTNHFAGFSGEWNFFNAGDKNYPTKGFHIASNVSCQNNLSKTDRNLLKINGSATIYCTFAKNLTFAHRTGGATIFGDFEFYQANTLGGNDNLRGYWRDRFAGRSGFYQNTELRYKLINLKGYVFRGRLGVFSFVDDGRVWIKDENSSQLHFGYGGGIFFVPYNLYSFNMFYSTSKEANMITVRAGFLF